MITDRIGRHPVLLPLLIACNTVGVFLRKQLSLRFSHVLKKNQPSFHTESKERMLRNKPQVVHHQRGQL